MVGGDEIGDGTPNALRETLMATAEQLLPVYEFAEGQKALLEQRGWSPTAAEEAAAFIMNGLLAAIL